MAIEAQGENPEEGKELRERGHVRSCRPAPRPNIGKTTARIGVAQQIAATIAPTVP